MKLYKLTDQNGNTQNNTNWIPKTTHEKQSCSNPELCSANVYHAYTNANWTLFINPIHADISNPRMFECSGDIVVSDWGKLGCFKKTSKKELQMPAWYTNQKTRKQVQVMFAVLCTESVLRVYETYSDDLRPRQAIEAAKEYLKYQTTGAADAAARAAYAAYAAAYAAGAAAGAACAAREAERRAQVDDLIRALNDAEVKARLKGLAAAGYCDRLAVRRLLADLRGQPGCERIQERSLNNYLAGRSRMPPTVEKGLDALIERGAGQ